MMTSNGPMQQQIRPVVAVTGATGCIGRALLAQLRSTATVRALVRSAAARARLEADGIEGVTGDLNDAGAMKHLVRGADVVYHCAATMGKADRRLSEQVNVEGTQIIATAALAAGVRRFVYVSSISVYAATRTRHGTITEEKQPEHIERLNFYSRTKLEAEHVVRRLGRDGLDYSILRPTNVYGPWSRPWFLQWEAMLRRTRFVIGDLPIDVVYVDDVAAAMVQVAAEHGGRNETFNIGHQAIALKEFIGRVGLVVGRPVRPVQRRLDAALRHAIDGGYRLFTGRSMSLSLTRAVWYPHDKAKHAFGYRPAIDLDRGFAALASWHAARGNGM